MYQSRLSFAPLPGSRNDYERRNQPAEYGPPLSHWEGHTREMRHPADYSSMRTGAGPSARQGGPPSNFEDRSPSLGHYPPHSGYQYVDERRELERRLPPPIVHSPHQTPLGSVGLYPHWGPPASHHFREYDPREHLRAQQSREHDASPSRHMHHQDGQFVGIHRSSHSEPISPNERMHRTPRVQQGDYVSPMRAEDVHHARAEDYARPPLSPTEYQHVYREMYSQVSQEHPYQAEYGHDAGASFKSNWLHEAPYHSSPYRETRDHPRSGIYDSPQGSRTAQRPSSGFAGALHNPASPSRGDDLKRRPGGSGGDLMDRVLNDASGGAYRRLPPLSARRPMPSEARDNHAARGGLAVSKRTSPPLGRGMDVSLQGHYTPIHPPIEPNALNMAQDYRSSGSASNRSPRRIFQSHPHSPVPVEGAPYTAISFLTPSNPENYGQKVPRDTRERANKRQKQNGKTRPGRPRRDQPLYDKEVLHDSTLRVGGTAGFPASMPVGASIDSHHLAGPNHAAPIGAATNINDSLSMEASTFINHGTTCHQCRQPRPPAELLRCTRSRSVPPGYLKICNRPYCRQCLSSRYGLDDSTNVGDLAKEWVCPRCMGECTCSSCMQKRGIPALDKANKETKMKAMDPKKKAIKTNLGTDVIDLDHFGARLANDAPVIKPRGHADPHTHAPISATNESLSTEQNMSQPSLPEANPEIGPSVHERPTILTKSRATTLAEMDYRNMPSRAQVDSLENVPEDAWELNAAVALSQMPLANSRPLIEDTQNVTSVHRVVSGPKKKKKTAKLDKPQQMSIATLMGQTQASHGAQRPRMQYPAWPKKPKTDATTFEAASPPILTAIPLPESLIGSEHIWKRLELREFLARFGSTVLRLPRWVILKFDDPRYVDEEDRQLHSNLKTGNNETTSSPQCGHSKIQWPQISSQVWRALLVSLCKIMRNVAAESKDREQTSIIKEAIKEISVQSLDIGPIWHRMLKLLRLLTQDDPDSNQFEDLLVPESQFSIDNKVEITLAMCRQLMGTWAIRDELERGSSSIREKMVKYHEELDSVKRTSESARLAAEELKTKATPFDWSQEQENERQTEISRIVDEREAKLSRLEVSHATDLLQNSARNPILAIDHNGNTYHRLLDIDRNPQRKGSPGQGSRWGRWIVVCVGSAPSSSTHADPDTATATESSISEPLPSSNRIYCINRAEQVHEMIKYMTSERTRLQNISEMNRYEADLATVQLVRNEMDRCLEDGVSYRDSEFGQPLREKLQVELASRDRQSGVDNYGNDKEWEEMLKRLNLASKWLSTFSEPEPSEIKSVEPVADDQLEEENVELDRIEEDFSMGDSEDDTKSTIDANESTLVHTPEPMVTRLRSRRQAPEEASSRDMVSDDSGDMGSEGSTSASTDFGLTKSGRVTRSQAR